MATGSTSANIASYDSGYAAYAVSNLTNGYANSSSTTYAQLTLTRGANAETYIYYRFGDLSSIPSSATINSVTIKAKATSTNNTASNVATRTIQPCTGATLKGSATTLSSSTSVRTLTAGSSWTRAELLSAGVYLRAVRGTSNTSSNYYLRFYGADITVSYTYQAQTFTVTATSNVSGYSFAILSNTYDEGSQVNVAISVAYGSPSYAGLVLHDNNVDVTSQIQEVFSTPQYIISSIHENHVITLDLPTDGRLFLKENGSWMVVTGVFSKSSGTWSQVADKSAAFSTTTKYIQGEDTVISTETSILFDGVAYPYNGVITLDPWDDSGTSDYTYGGGSWSQIHLPSTKTVVVTKHWASGKTTTTSETTNVSITDGTLEYLCWDSWVQLSTDWSTGDIDVLANTDSEGGETITGTVYIYSYDDFVGAVYIYVVASPE